ncbi:uncharacterized protein LOC131245963 [Magnolia sinica]|uniref:uncharacterized protein LOC131245963 n=1 Tax=Magnolia sinica TaxID=86752 RepID=UPI002658DE07|nr:uncharacterized protein LOC131245963 [Magnolia sinica]
MHLWPSLRIRDSFKLSYLNKVERNLHRMKSEKQSQTNQKLLGNQSEINERDDREIPNSKIANILSLCREFLMMFTCCYCCFCCGACDDQEDN